MLNWEEKRETVKVAKLYHFDGWTQAQIAKKQGVSRPVISKMLQRARDEGIVEIYIKDESVHTVDLEQKLEKKYGLKEAVVVSTTGFTPDLGKRLIGKAAASYVAKRSEQVKRIGISWGTTLRSLIEEYPYVEHRDIQITPLIGGMGNKYVHLHSNQLAFHFAQKMNASCSYLYAPAMVETDDLKERLVQSKDIAQVLEEGRNVELALVGLGNPLQHSTMETMGYLQEEDIVTLRKAGAVGDISSKFFDALGHGVDHPINNRVIGLTLEEIKNIPEVVGVAQGSHKVLGIEAALKGGYLDVLIVDNQIAEALTE